MMARLTRLARLVPLVLALIGALLVGVSVASAHGGPTKHGATPYVTECQVLTEHDNVMNSGVVYTTWGYVEAFFDVKRDSFDNICWVRTSIHITDNSATNQYVGTVQTNIYYAPGSGVDPYNAAYVPDKTWSNQTVNHGTTVNFDGNWNTGNNCTGGAGWLGDNTYISTSNQVFTNDDLGWNVHGYC